MGFDLMASWHLLSQPMLQRSITPVLLHTMGDNFKYPSEEKNRYQTSILHACTSIIFVSLIPISLLISYATYGKNLSPTSLKYPVDEIPISREHPTSIIHPVDSTYRRSKSPAKKTPAYPQKPALGLSRGSRCQKRWRRGRNRISTGVIEQTTIE